MTRRPGPAKVPEKRENMNVNIKAVLKREREVKSIKELTNEELLILKELGEKGYIRRFTTAAHMAERKERNI